MEWIETTAMRAVPCAYLVLDDEGHLLLFCPYDIGTTRQLWHQRQLQLHGRYACGGAREQIMMVLHGMAWHLTL